MTKERKRCPKCYGMGSGPFLKPVWNQRRRRIYHYWYFAHRRGDELKWCYIGKRSGEREEEREEEELGPGDSCPECGGGLHISLMGSKRPVSVYCPHCGFVVRRKHGGRRGKA